MTKTVYIVHAVDVEGPMTETLGATFERMQAYGLPADIAVSTSNLASIQAKSFNGLAEPLATRLAQVFNHHSLSYLTDWSQIDAMLLDITSPNYRRRFCGKDGSPYRFSWFLYDHHHDFTNNPRFHVEGTHAIFDHYQNLFLEHNVANDGVYWHYHQPSIDGDALESNTCWTNRTTHETIIAKRIIERNWYFSCFRAGLHIERNDMSHWLEMFTPFDFSGRYARDESCYVPGSDFDWRGCPNVWGGWRPDWYDYRCPGTMRRHIFRCTDLWTYLSILDENDVDEAFEQAMARGKSVLTYYNHDYRDMRPEIAAGYDVIQRVAQRYPDVNWIFVNALEAAQRSLDLTSRSPALSYTLEGDLLLVRAGDAIFGPQPFLAIQENDVFFRDNFTQEAERLWAYRFRKRSSVRAFGVAASSPSGVVDVLVRNLVRI